MVCSGPGVHGSAWAGMSASVMEDMDADTASAPNPHGGDRQANEPERGTPPLQTFVRTQGLRRRGAPRITGGRCSRGSDKHSLSVSARSFRLRPLPQWHCCLWVRAWRVLGRCLNRADSGSLIRQDGGSTGAPGRSPQCMFPDSWPIYLHVCHFYLAVVTISFSSFRPAKRSAADASSSGEPGCVGEPWRCLPVP
jgi:hypothetical protein